MLNRRSNLALAVVFLLVICCGTTIVQGSSPPPMPLVLSGTIEDAAGPVAGGTVRAYIDGELRGEREFSGGAYTNLLVQGDAQSANRPVSFTVLVAGTEYEAVSSPETVNWRSGRISGVDYPMVDLVVPEEIVLQKPKVLLSVHPASTSLEEGQSRQISVTVDPPDAQLTYSSSDASVASVSDAGMILAHREGSATITVTADKEGYDSSSAQVRVTVIYIIDEVVHTLTLFKEGLGTTEPVIGNHAYAEGTQLFLTAIPAAGWQFEKWIINGTDFYEADTTITMDEDKTATAYFAEALDYFQKHLYPGWNTLSVPVKLRSNQEVSGSNPDSPTRLNQRKTL